jgi:hypothetical protein
VVSAVAKGATAGPQGNDVALAEEACHHVELSIISTGRLEMLAMIDCSVVPFEVVLVLM